MDKGGAARSALSLIDLQVNRRRTVIMQKVASTLGAVDALMFT